MSTITVVAKDGFAAIAADSLITWGSTGKDGPDYIVNHSKIMRCGGSYLGISGSTAAMLALKRYFNSMGDPDLSTIDRIFETWLKLHLALRDEYFLNPKESTKDAFESSRIDVLIANENGIFGVDGHRAVQQFSKYYSYGTGSQHALGAMYAAYSQPNPSAEDIAKLGVQAAAEFDLDTGLPIISYALRLRR